MVVRKCCVCEKVYVYQNLEVDDHFWLENIECCMLLQYPYRFREILTYIIILNLCFIVKSLN